MIFAVTIAILGLAAGSPRQATAAPLPPTSAPSPPLAGGDSPVAGDLPIVSLPRIQRKLSRTPILRPDLDKPIFRVEVFARHPGIEEILGPDYLKGPVSYGGFTHSEFLNMVTPKDVQGFAAFSNREGFVVAATSIALKWALQKAITKLTNAVQEREREAARREVQDALAALQRARQKAGLPPK